MSFRAGLLTPSQGRGGNRSPTHHVENFSIVFKNFSANGVSLVRL